MQIGGGVALRQDLLTAPSVTAEFVENASGAYRASATESLLVTVTHEGGQLRGELTDTDLATQQAVQVFSAYGKSYVEVVNALAKRLDSHAQDFSTSSDAALREYVAYLQTRDKAAKEAALRQAIASDPSFGLAYIALIEQIGADPAMAVQASSRFTPVDRARFDVLTARMGHQPLSDVAAAMQKLVDLTPNDGDSLAGLGTERFLLGDAMQGERLLRRAVEVAPNSQEVRHQLALGLMAVRRFDAALSVYRQMTDQAAIQPELATCLLLKGDGNAANRVMEQYFSTQAHGQGPAANLIRANWTAASQGLEQGAVNLASQQFAAPLLASVAASQGAIWDLALGRDADASHLLQGAPKVSGNAFADIYTAAASAALNAKGDPRVTAYSLYLRHQYDAAAQTWTAIDTLSDDTDLRARAMLAASLQHAGRAAEAKKVRVQPFPPNIVGADPYAAVSFWEMRRLLGL